MGWSCRLESRAGVAGWSCGLESRAGVAGWSCGLELQAGPQLAESAFEMVLVCFHPPTHPTTQAQTTPNADSANCGPACISSPQLQPATPARNFNAQFQSATPARNYSPQLQPATNAHNSSLILQSAKQKSVEVQSLGGSLFRADI